MHPHNFSLSRENPRREFCWRDGLWDCNNYWSVQKKKKKKGGKRKKGRKTPPGLFSAALIPLPLLRTSCSAAEPSPQSFSTPPLLPAGKRGFAHGSCLLCGYGSAEKLKREEKKSPTFPFFRIRGWSHSVCSSRVFTPLQGWDGR